MEDTVGEMMYSCEPLHTGEQVLASVIYNNSVLLKDVA